MQGGTELLEYRGADLHDDRLLSLDAIAGEQ